jgi:lipoprotein NlpI
MRISAVLFGLAALFVVAGPVLAVSDGDRDDCAAEDPERNIAGCTRIIQGRGETAKSRASAYNNRGVAYKEKGDLNRAIADLNEAIRLDPKDGLAYNNRGRAYLYSGKLAKALADVSQANKLDPKSAYAALWVDIVRQRNNVPSRLTQAVSTIDMAAWPAPVIRMFLGQMTPAAVLAAAADPDAYKKKGQVCEANFYSGELALRQGAKDDAARLFRLAASDWPHTFTEWGDANAELKALGAAR